MIYFSLQLALRHVKHSLVLLLLGMGLTPAYAVTLDFAGVKEGPYTGHSQYGFSVAPLTGTWIGGYGVSPPFIYFENLKEGSTIKSSIKVSRGNTTFKFASVDLYSSITTIPYTFTGYLNSKVVFQVSGTIPNTFGNFATAKNPQAETIIDSLEITLTNTTPPCCSNPMGLDNIVVASSTAYLDVAALPDINGDGVMDQAVLVMKGDSYYLQSIDSATGKLIKQALLGTASAIKPTALTSMGQQISILAAKSTGASILQIRDAASLSLVKTLTLPK